MLTLHALPKMRCRLNNFRARLSLHMPKRSVAGRRLFPALQLVILLLFVENRILGIEKIIEPMRAFSEGIPRGNQESSGKLAKIAQLLWPRLVELWISLA